LQDTDRRVGEGKPVAPSFLLACVLWSDVRESWAQRRVKQPPFPALQDAIDEVFESRIGDVSGRGKLGTDMREIWMMQPRFEKRVGSGPWSLVEQVRFRAGFDFMRLRADVGEVDEVLADWWQEFSLADDGVREDLLQQVRSEQQKAQRAPRVHAVKRASKSPSAPGASSSHGETADPRFRDADNNNQDDLNDDDMHGDAAPAKKRRRRRRKPSGGSGNAPTTD
jgi:poly(A) polymerase